MLLAAISSGVIGRASDMLGVWMAPVMAQLMTTLPGMGWGFLGWRSGDVAPLAARRLDRAG
jgi:hypothetical protein